VPELDMIVLLKAITYKKRLYYVTEGNYGPWKSKKLPLWRID